MNVKGILSGHAKDIGSLYIKRNHGNNLLINCDSEDVEIEYENDKTLFTMKNINIWALDSDPTKRGYRKLYNENKVPWLKKVTKNVWINNHTLEELSFSDEKDQWIVPDNKFIR